MTTSNACSPAPPSGRQAMTDDLEELRRLHAAIRRCLTIEAGWKKRREALEKQERALSLRMGKRAEEERKASDDRP